jgi:hypothetical protein
MSQPSILEQSDLTSPGSVRISNLPFLGCVGQEFFRQLVNDWSCCCIFQIQLLQVVCNVKIASSRRGRPQELYRDIKMLTAKRYSGPQKFDHEIVFLPAQTEDRRPHQFYCDIEVLPPPKTDYTTRSRRSLHYYSARSVLEKISRAINDEPSYYHGMDEAPIMITSDRTPQVFYHDIEVLPPADGSFQLGRKSEECRLFKAN